MVKNSSLKDEILSNVHFLTIPAILFFSSCVKLKTLQNSSLEKRNIVERSWKFQPFCSFCLGWNWRRWEFKSLHSSCLKLKTLQNAWLTDEILSSFLDNFNHFGLFVLVKIEDVVEFLTYRRNFVGCSKVTKEMVYFSHFVPFFFPLDWSSKCVVQRSRSLQHKLFFPFSLIFVELQAITEYFWQPKFWTFSVFLLFSWFFLELQGIVEFATAS